MKPDDIAKTMKRGNGTDFRSKNQRIMLEPISELAEQYSIPLEYLIPERKA